MVYEGQALSRIASCRVQEISASQEVRRHGRIWSPTSLALFRRVETDLRIRILPKLHLETNTVQANGYPASRRFGKGPTPLSMGTPLGVGLSRLWQCTFQVEGVMNDRRGSLAQR